MLGWKDAGDGFASSHAAGDREVHDDGVELARDEIPDDEVLKEQLRALGYID